MKGACCTNNRFLWAVAVHTCQLLSNFNQTWQSSCNTETGQHSPLQGSSLCYNYYMHTCIFTLVLYMYDMYSYEPLNNHCTCMYVHVHVYVHTYIYVAVPRQDSMSPARENAVLLGTTTDLLDIPRQTTCMYEPSQDIDKVPQYIHVPSFLHVGCLGISNKCMYYRTSFKCVV